MEDNKNKELDAFIHKVVKEVGFEKPAEGFTVSVLSKIELIAKKNSVEYTPIISKFTWVGIVFLVITVFTYVILTNSAIETAGWLNILKLNKLTAFNTSLKMPKLFISNAYMYGCMGLAFFVGIQVFFLKHHFEKRYTLD